MASAVPYLCCIGIASGIAAGQPAEWKKYADSSHGFRIEYPASTRPEHATPSEADLMVAFPFEQAVNYEGDSSTFKFRFEIYRVRNSNRLPSPEWAKQQVPPEMRLELRNVAIAGREGAQVRTHDLSWGEFRNFVADGDWMYELRYYDMVTPKILDPDVRAFWSRVFDRMLRSFEFTSEK